MKKQPSLTKNVKKAILSPILLYGRMNRHIDDLVWLLEPAQNHIDPKSFKENVRSLVKQMARDNKKARRARDRLWKII